MASAESKTVHGRVVSGRGRRMGRIMAAGSAVLAAALLSVPADVPRAQQPKTPEQVEAELVTWMEEQATQNALTPEQQEQFRGLSAALSDPSHDVRESATLGLLLLPTGCVKELRAVARDASNPEAQMRAHWVFEVFRSNRPVAVAYLSRASGLPFAVVQTGIEQGGVVIDEILERTPPARLGNDIRIWSALVQAATGDDSAGTVMAMFRERNPDQPHLVMYNGLRRGNTASKPEGRAKIISVVPVSPPDEALALLEASADDGAAPVRAVRTKLLERLRGAMDARALLSRWSAEGVSVHQKRTLLEILSLKDADPETRAAWIAIGTGELEEELGGAFLSFACREGIAEVIDSHVKSAGQSDRFYSLLSIAGTAESWAKALDAESGPAAVHAAMGWLPCTTLPVARQAEMLMGLLDSPSKLVRDGAAHLLSGYGTAEVTAALLARVRANPADASLAALAWHGHNLCATVAEPWKEPWWAQLGPAGEVRLLRWYETPGVADRLLAYTTGADHVASEMALDELLRRRHGVIGLRRFAAWITLNESAPVESDPLLPDRLLSVEEEYAWILRARENAAKAEGDAAKQAQAEAALAMGELVRSPMLAVSGHDGFRTDIRTGRAVREHREVVLAMYPDADTNGDLAALVSRSPEKLLVDARIFAVLGHHEAVVDALLASARAGTLPPSLDLDVVMYSVSRSARIADPTGLFASLHRVNNDELRLGIASILMARGSTVPVLMAVDAIGQRSNRVTLRARMALAATGSPDLSADWLARAKARWAKGDGADTVLAALAAAEAFLAGDPVPLEAGMAGSEGHLHAALAARLGSRHGLAVLMDAVLETDELDRPDAEFTGGQWPSLLPIQLFRGAPEGMPAERWRMYWRATRHAWEWSPEHRQFVLGGGSSAGKAGE